MSHVKNFDDQKIPREIPSETQVFPVFVCGIEEKPVISGLNGKLPVNRWSEKKRQNSSFFSWQLNAKTRFSISAMVFP